MAIHVAAERLAAGRVQGEADDVRGLQRLLGLGRLQGFEDAFDCVDDVFGEIGFRRGLGVVAEGDSEAQQLAAELRPGGGPQGADLGLGEAQHGDAVPDLLIPDLLMGFDLVVDRLGLGEADRLP